MSFCRAGFRKDRNVRSATSAAHRVPSNVGPSPRAAGMPLPVGAAIPGSQHCHRPKGALAHTLHSRAPGGLASGMLRHPSAAVPLALPHDHRARNASPCQTHPTAMAGNSPVFSHACKSSLPIGRDALVGPIPEEVGKLSNLGGLGLIGHHITGPIPESLNDLEKFHGLGIRHTLN